MHSEDRIIHFSTELIHAPMQHKVSALQKLYFELSQGRMAYESSDFSSPPQFKFYSRRGPNTQSVALLLPDRLMLIEEWADLALVDFQEKVREIARRTSTELGIPFFGAQAVTLRSTFALSHFKDSRVFLFDHACQQGGLIGPHFRRPIGVGGLRFVLPETDEHPYILHVVIESFRHSTTEIFVEVKGIFNNQHIDAESMETAAANIRLVRNFVTESIFPYLDQFDTPEDVES